MPAHLLAISCTIWVTFYWILPGQGFCRRIIKNCKMTKKGTKGAMPTSIDKYELFISCSKRLFDK